MHFKIFKEFEIVAQTCQSFVLKSIKFYLPKQVFAKLKTKVCKWSMLLT